MSTMPLTAVTLSSLADAVDEVLVTALTGDAAPCLWCGGAVVVVSADAWSGRVVLRCEECGSELEGEVQRHLLEVPA